MLCERLNGIRANACGSFRLHPARVLKCVLKLETKMRRGNICKRLRRLFSAAAQRTGSTEATGLAYLRKCVFFRPGL